MGRGEGEKRSFSPSALSLFRFHLSSFPPETPDTQATKRKPSFSFCISQLAPSFLKDFEISGCGLKRKTRLLLVNQFFLLPSVKKKKNLLTQSRLVKPCKLVFLVDDLGHLGHPVKALLPLWYFLLYFFSPLPLPPFLLSPSHLP